jgi:hypothetical protein
LRSNSIVPEANCGFARTVISASRARLGHPIPASGHRDDGKDVAA